MISDDDLLLYYYRDGLDPTERERIGQALAREPEVARRLHVLIARLDAAAKLPEVDVPAGTMQRWQTALDRAASKHTRKTSSERRSFLMPRWQLAAAALAGIALFLGYRQLNEPGQPEHPMTAATQPASPSATREASPYEKGLKFHLASTERQLASLKESTPEERARLVDTIIGQNRLYALAAERAGEPQLARVLRAFTPVLEDVASDRGEASADSLAQLNFELRVMQARLGAGAATPTQL